MTVALTADAVPSAVGRQAARHRDWKRRMEFERYAIYFTPQGDLGAAGASWLGWDIAQGHAPSQPVIAGLEIGALTEAPRKYGFHATIKPPFALASGCDLPSLRREFADLCTDLAPVWLNGLSLTWMGSFLALTPLGDVTDLNACAAHVVRTLDPFRAPLTAADFARRQQARLSDRQLRNLCDWGYPHLMDSFRFHITLTGRVPRNMRAQVETAATEQFAAARSKPIVLKDLTLVGQGTDGMFRAIQTTPLGG